MRVAASLLLLALAGCAENPEPGGAPDADRLVQEPDYYELETSIRIQLGQDPGAGDAALALTEPAAYSEWDVASELVPLRLETHASYDQVVAYYDINGIGGWFGPPNQTLEVWLQPYAIGDGSTFHIQGLLAETRTGAVVGGDSTLIYAR